MSTTVDQRVVSMQFDNKHFESNVQTTMSTLDKLKEKLNLTGITKGFDDVDKAAKRINLNGLSSAAETVAVKFSYMQSTIQHQLNKIVDSAVSAGKKVVSAFTTEPIKAGFSEYETQINAVQTILANTSSKGTTIDDVNSALDTLNAYADKTIYNFTEMTRNIGTFTAAGIELDTATTAIQGIANLAAVSGSTSQQASTAMYQLSQALSSGTVKLQDWNSVVNAGMGGQVFQDSLKETSRLMASQSKEIKYMSETQRAAWQESHGYTDAQMTAIKNYSYNVDALVKKNGSFRESLSEGWITADVLTMTLNKMTKTGVVDYIANMTSVTRESVVELQNLGDTYGYDSEQVKELALAFANGDEAMAESIISTVKMASTAEDAATKVKTFSQLMDTLKEAAQSGWTQTWELLIGDFEEAKELWTSVSDVLSKAIGDSANARNELIGDWVEMGGRTQVIDSLKNAFDGLLNILTPIKEAFQEVFPPATADQLYEISSKFETLTEQFKMFTSEHSENIKSAFTGIFSAIDIGLTLVKSIGKGILDLAKNFTGLSGGILESASSFGEWLTGLRDTVEETDIFGVAVGKITDIIQKVIDKLKEFASFVKEKLVMPGWEGFLSLMSAIWDVMQNIGSKIASIASDIGNALANAFRSGDIASGLDVINGGLLTSVLIGIKNFMNGLEETAEESEGFLDKLKGCLDGVQESLEAWQQNLKADTLLKLAGAIGILAASLLLIATIKPEKLTSSLAAITVLFGELLGSLAIFTKLDGAFTGAGKAVTTMIGMSTAILILAAALKTISSLSWSELAVGLTGLTVTLGVLVAAVKILEKGTNIASGAGQMLIMAAALTILAGALKIIATMSWSELAVGLTGLTVTLGVLVAAVKILEKGTDIASGAGQMVLMAGALTILAGALKIIATMSWSELAVGLTGLTVTLGVLVGALVILDKMKNSMVGSAAAIAIISGSMLTLAGVLKVIASMSWSELAVGLAGLAGSLAIMVATLAILDKMKGSMIGSSAAILVMAAAIAVLTPSLMVLGNMSIGEIIKSLVTLAATFAVIGVAGYLLAPITPAILSFSAAVALLGVACLAVGAGISLFAAALGTLTTVTAAGATAIVAALTIIVTGIAGLIPAIVEKIGEGIITFCDVIADSAESIGNAVKTVVLTLLDVIVECAPAIVDALFELIIAALNIFTQRMPELVQAAVDAFMAFFSSVVDALKGMDTSTLVQGIIGVGLLAALIAALGAITSLIPSAMVGVIGMGVVIAELAIVLAAIGALAQIPGLEWLINEGGDFLQSIGTAIGQFVGGIVGGIAKGITSTLPDIGSDLSAFMDNATPFIEGAKSIDSKVADGVLSLAEVILTLTAANILNGITSWITGGTSIVDFGKDLAEFGPYFKSYYNSIKDVNGDVVQASANAANALAEMANNLPNKGGIVSWFTGDNDIASFGKSLMPFGTAMKKYADEVSGIDSDVVVSSANAAKALAELANNLPNTGGIVSWFTGDNDLAGFGTSLVSFGKNFAEYSDHMKDVDAGVLTATTNAANSIVELQKSLPEEGGWFSDDMSLSDFGKDMSKFGEKIGEYYENISGVDTTQMSSVITQTNNLVSMLKSMSGIDTSSTSAFVTGLETLAQNGVNSFVSAFSNAHSRASEAVSQFMNSAVTGINAKSYQFTSAGQDIINKLITGIRTKNTSVSEAFTSVVGGALTSIKNKYSEFSSVGKGLMTNLISGIKDKSSSVSDTAKSVASTAASKAKESYDSFYSAGKYLVQGFAAGITAETWRAEAEARAMAEDAYNAAMEELDSHSPSRVFMKVGSYVAQGFALGIQSDTSESTTAASDMASNTIDSVRNAISRISDVINSDIDTQPTIRPVLDLSNVEAGTGRLQAMFSRNQALSVSASMSRDSSIDTTTDATTSNTGNTYQFTQINNSPKALSRTEIYRQTSNQFSAFERMVKA